MASRGVPRPASETVKRDDDDVRRSDRDSDPIIRRVPLCLFLPPNTTFAHSPSPPQVPDTPPPFPLHHHIDQSSSSAHTYVLNDFFSCPSLIVLSMLCPENNERHSLEAFY